MEGRFTRRKPPREFNHCILQQGISNTHPDSLTAMCVTKVDFERFPEKYRPAVFTDKPPSNMEFCKKMDNPLMDQFICTDAKGIIDFNDLTQKHNKNQP